MNHPALQVESLGDVAGARAFAEQVLAGFREVLGERHPETLRSIDTLAETLRGLGDLAGACALHEEALAGRREVLGERHYETVISAWGLYRVLRDLDPPAATAALDHDLRWLLDADPEGFTADQVRIRDQVTEAVRRSDWGGADDAPAR
jgi:hypothetical protein